MRHGNRRMLYIRICSTLPFSEIFSSYIISFDTYASLGSRHDRFYYPILQMRNVRNGVYVIPKDGIAI